MKLEVANIRSLGEKWVQQHIADDPSLLGLGDLILKDKERRQPRAGRLDLLLQDPETLKRFEVDVQLGPTDESHLIRTIEYWDIERKLYPQAHIIITIKLPKEEQIDAELESVGFVTLPYDEGWRRYRLRVSGPLSVEQRAVLIVLMRKARNLLAKN